MMDIFIRRRLIPSTLFFQLQVKLFFLIFFLVSSTGYSSSREDNSENYLLCKYCGADTADLEYALEVISPSSLKITNQSFGGRLVTVQSLKNPSGVHFDVVTVKKSNCLGYGLWTKQNSWFPGYAWKVCVCQPWGHFLGWVFEPSDLIQNNQKKASEKGFYALILDNILTEKFSNSLLVVPKSFTS